MIPPRQNNGHITAMITNGARLLEMFFPEKYEIDSVNQVYVLHNVEDSQTKEKYSLVRVPMDKTVLMVKEK